MMIDDGGGSGGGDDDDDNDDDVGNDDDDEGDDGNGDDDDHYDDCDDDNDGKDDDGHIASDCNVTYFHDENAVDLAMFPTIIIVMLQLYTSLELNFFFVSTENSSFCIISNRNAGATSVPTSPKNSRSTTQTPQNGSRSLTE